ERGAIDRALSAYLWDLEDAYQRDLREDYPIFPSGRLKYDVPKSLAEARSAGALRPKADTACQGECLRSADRQAESPRPVPPARGGRRRHATTGSGVVRHPSQGDRRL